MDEIIDFMIDNPGVPTIITMMIGRDISLAITLAMLVF